MAAPRELRGVPASPGDRRRRRAPARRGRAAAATQVAAGAPRRRARARARRARSARRASSRRSRRGCAPKAATADAEIVETGALMALDPGLAGRRERRASADGRLGAGRDPRGVPAQADVLAALPDEMLAARADDVRSLGRRAALHVVGEATDAHAEGRDEILVAEDLGPADVAELERRRARASRSPAAARPRTPRSSPAVARRPAGRGARCRRAGARARASCVIGRRRRAAPWSSSPDARAGASSARRGRAAAAHAGASARSAARRCRPRRPTASGSRCWPTSPAPPSCELALEAGAEGVGLLRTELAFLDATGVAVGGRAPPRARADPRGLGGRPATVRVLDFGGDKTPPFLDRRPAARHRAAARRAARRWPRSCGRSSTRRRGRRAARAAADGAVAGRARGDGRRRSRDAAARRRRARAAARPDDRDAGGGVPREPARARARAS